MAAPSTPQLHPDESRGYIINIVGWTGVSIATIFVALRLCSRKWITHSVGWDDALIVIATILQISTISLSSTAVAHGNGRHIYYLSNDQIMKMLYYSVILQPIGIAAFCLPKLSVVILIMGLMGPQRRESRVWFLYAIITMQFITSALSAIMLFAQSNPPNHLWHPFSPGNGLPDHVLDNITIVAGGKLTIRSST